MQCCRDESASPLRGAEHGGALLDRCGASGGRAAAHRLAGPGPGAALEADHRTDEAGQPLGDAARVGGRARRLPAGSVPPARRAVGRARRHTRAPLGRGGGATARDRRAHRRHGEGVAARAVARWPRIVRPRPRRPARVASVAARHAIPTALRGAPGRCVPKRARRVPAARAPPAGGRRAGRRGLCPTRLRAAAPSRHR